MSIRKGSLVEVKPTGMRLYVSEINNESVQLSYISPADMMTNKDFKDMVFHTEVTTVHISHLELVSNPLS